MSNFVFRRIRGRIIPIAVNAINDAKNIPSAFKSLPKVMNKSKASRVVSKMEGKIAGAKSFLEDSPNLHHSHRNKLRSEISRTRTRIFKIENSLDDSIQRLNKAKLQKESGIRGVKTVSTVGAIGSISAYLIGRNKK